MMRSSLSRMPRWRHIRYCMQCDSAFVLQCIIVCQLTAGSLDEYCNTETFRPHCSNGEVIVIEDAIYGRHHVGKCIDVDEANVFKDPRYFGCSINVRRFLDAKCSARKTCEVRIADAELEKKSPCLKGLKMFLEASYTWVAGEWQPYLPAFQLQYLIT